MKNILIIGRGPSVLRCKKEWVDQFDEVAIINNMVVEGYEKQIGSRFTTWIRNLKCSNWCDKKRADKYGLKKVVHITNFREDGFQEYMDNFPLKIESDCVPLDVSEWFVENYDGLDPSLGIRSIEYCIRNEYDLIGMVGIDLFRVGEPKYFTGKDKQQRAHGHSTPKSIIYMNDVIQKNPQIQFRIVSDAEGINEAPNVRFNLEI